MAYLNEESLEIYNCVLIDIHGEFSAVEVGHSISMKAQIYAERETGLTYVLKSLCPLVSNLPIEDTFTKILRHSGQTRRSSLSSQQLSLLLGTIRRRCKHRQMLAYPRR